MTAATVVDHDFLLIEKDSASKWDRQTTEQTQVPDEEWIRQTSGASAVSDFEEEPVRDRARSDSWGCDYPAEDMNEVEDENEEQPYESSENEENEEPEIAEPKNDGMTAHGADSAAFLQEDEQADTANLNNDVICDWDGGDLPTYRRPTAVENNDKDSVIAMGHDSAAFAHEDTEERDQDCSSDEEDDDLTTWGMPRLHTPTHTPASIKPSPPSASSTSMVHADSMVFGDLDEDDEQDPRDTSTDEELNWANLPARLYDHGAKQESSGQGVIARADSKIWDQGDADDDNEFASPARGNPADLEEPVTSMPHLHDDLHQVEKSGDDATMMGRGVADSMLQDLEAEGQRPLDEIEEEDDGPTEW